VEVCQSTLGTACCETHIKLLLLCNTSEGVAIKNHGSISDKLKGFSLLGIHTGAKAYPASHQMNSVDSFSEGKVARK
jgi:hypothetical protein